MVIFWFIGLVECIALGWLVLVLIKPSKFFFFVKPETKWKRLKAIGVVFAIYAICLLLFYIAAPDWFINDFSIKHSR